jgi:hypothetical protein
MKISLGPTLRFASAMAVVVLLAIGGAATINRVRAQARQTATPLVAVDNPEPLNIQFQYGTLTATTNTINATEVPITTASGTLLYENLTIPFSVSQDSEGRYHVVAGSIVSVPSPMTQIEGFIAGNYAGPGSATAQLITLSAPGVTSNGATQWSVAQTPGATACTWPQTATFYVGPVEDNPNYSSIQKAEIATANYNYSYGVEGDQSCSDYYWGPGAILGFSQTGNALTIVSFYSAGANYGTPQDQITYQLVQQ